MIALASGDRYEKAPSTINAFEEDGIERSGLSSSSRTTPWTSLAADLFVSGTHSRLASPCLHSMLSSSQCTRVAQFHPSGHADLDPLTVVLFVRNCFIRGVLVAHRQPHPRG